MRGMHAVVAEVQCAFDFLDPVVALDDPPSGHWIDASVVHGVRDGLRPLRDVAEHVVETRRAQVAIAFRQTVRRQYCGLVGGAGGVRVLQG